MKQKLQEAMGIPTSLLSPTDLSLAVLLQLFFGYPNAGSYSYPFFSDALESLRVITSPDWFILTFTLISISSSLYERKSSQHGQRQCNLDRWHPFRLGRVC